MRQTWKRGAAIAVLSLLTVPMAQAQDQKPNILVIMGDDVGITNISAYSHGLMGYQTPNIVTAFPRAQGCAGIFKRGRR